MKIETIINNLKSIYATNNLLSKFLEEYIKNLESLDKSTYVIHADTNTDVSYKKAVNDILMDNKNKPLILKDMIFDSIIHNKLSFNGRISCVKKYHLDKIIRNYVEIKAECFLLVVYNDM